MQSILNKYKASGNLKLFLDLRKNSLLDQSGNGNVVSGVTSNGWKNTKYGRGIRFRANVQQYLTVTANTSLRSTEGLLVFFCDGFNTQYINQTLFDMKAGTGTRVNAVITGAGAVQLYDGVTNPSLNASIIGKKMVAIRFKTGTKPDLFLDGVFVTAGTANSTIANAPTGDFIVGGYDYYPAGCDATVLAAAFINTSTVTNQEISQLYDELMAERGVQGVLTRGFLSSAPPVDSSCALAYDMETKTGAGLMADLSGNGKNGTILAGNVLSKFKSNLPAIVPLAASPIITFSAVDLGTSYTLETALRIERDGCEYFEQSGNSYGFYYDAGILYHAANGVAVTWTIGDIRNTDAHIVLERTDTAVNLYLNGVSQGEKTLASNQVFNGNVRMTSAVYYAQGLVGYFQAYTVNKGASWAKDRYARFAKSVIYKSNLDDVPPTTSNVTAGYIPFTDWELRTGTWKESEEAVGNKRKAWLENVVAGDITIENKGAFGTYVMEFLKTNASTGVILLSATKKGVYNQTGQNGYMIVLDATEALYLGKLTSGSFLSLANTAVSYIAPLTAYKLAITRSTSGVLTAYIKGGAFTDWTLWSVAGGGGANPTAADSTFTTSQYFDAQLNAGDKFRLLGIHQGVLTLGQLSALY